MRHLKLFPVLLCALALVSNAEDASREKAEALYKDINKSEDRKLRLRAADQLSNYQGPMIMKVIERALKNPDWHVRDRAVQAIMLHGEKIAGKALKALYRDKDCRVRATVLLNAAELWQDNAVDIMAKAAKDKKSVSIRQAAAEGLGLVPYAGDEEKLGKKTLDILETLLQDKDLRPRIAAVQSLAKLKGSQKAIDILAKACANEYEEVVAQAAEILADRATPDTIDTILKIAKSSKDLLQIRALLALSYIPNEVDAKVFLKLAGSRNWEVRAAACDTMGRIGDQNEERKAIFEKALIKLLRDKDWGVRSCAAWALARLRCRDAVKPMIPLVDETNNELILEALEAMTGQKGMTDDRHWAAWYTKHFELTELNPMCEIGFQSESDFYGIQSNTRNLLYVIDTSGSMKEGGKLIHLKAELWRSVKALQEDTVFNMISFQSGVSVYFSPPKQQATGDPRRASWRNKIALKKKSDAVPPAGWTALFDGAEIALDQWDVDTIYLLTDGMPTKGKITAPNAIISKLTEKNYDKRVVTRINTLAFAIEEAAVFLGELAEKNFGRYRFVPIQ